IALSACNQGPAYRRDLPGFWETVAEKERAEAEILMAQAEPDVKTICGDEIAMELEPELDELLDVATSYWAQEGFPDIVTGGNYDCDIMVRFIGEDDERITWKNTEEAGAAHL